MSESLEPHGLQHARLPCPSPSPGVCSRSCPLNWCCHPTISSSFTLFSFCLQSFLASGSFPVSWLFASAQQSIGASASTSVLPVNIQGWFPLGLTGLISLLYKGPSRVCGYIYAMEYYAATKRNTSESMLMRWMKLEPITQSEVSQKEKSKYCLLTHLSGI